MKPKHFFTLLVLAFGLLAMNQKLYAGEWSMHNDYDAFHELSKQFIDLSESADLLVDGFRTALSGETIRYTSPLPGAQTALITRQEKNSKPMIWLTADGKPGMKRFIWLAGLGCNLGEAEFILSAADQRVCAFRSWRKNEWQVQSANGAVLSFSALSEDQHHDLFGLMTLQWPELENKPLTIRIAPVSGDEKGWCMVFQYSDLLADIGKTIRNGFWYQLEKMDQEKTAMTLPSGWLNKVIEWRNDQGVAYKGKATRTDDRIFFSLKSFPLRLFVDGRQRDCLTAWPEQGYVQELHQDSMSVIRTLKDSLLACSGHYTRDLVGRLHAVQKGYFSAGRIDIMSSSHQDIAWMDSPNQCMLDRDSKVLTPALALLEQNPDFRYSAEQALMLYEYLYLHPEDQARITRLSQEGRLEWGATYNQPYEGLYSGEELVRQAYLGRKRLQKLIPGCDSRVAWNVDVPGRTLQMPQILAKSGIPYLFLSRHEQGLFYWSSPDGSSVGVYSPGHYHENSNFMRQSFMRIIQELPAVFEQWQPFYQEHHLNRHLPVLVSTDMGAPFDYEPLRESWNHLTLKKECDSSTPLNLPQIHYTTAVEFMDAIFSTKPKLPVITGERPNVWLYIHGPTHHWAISAHREAGHLLPAAEKWQTIASLLKNHWRDYPAQTLTDAWEAAIYPDHGWGGKNGDITDSTFQAKYEKAVALARQEIDSALSYIAGRIRYRDSGQGITVFNEQSWPRSGAVRIKKTFPKGWAKAVSLQDNHGQEIPCQILAQKNHSDGSLAEGELLFMATLVPSLGYRTYYLQPNNKTAAKKTDLSAIETRHYLVELVPGGIKRIYDKDLSQELARTDKFLFAELFTMQSVGNGAGEFSEVQQPTMQDFDRIKNHQPLWTNINDGPVCATWQLEQKLDHVLYRQSLIVYKQIKRIDIHVDLLQWDGTPYREFRLAFPLNENQARVSYSVPFGVVTVGESEIHGAAGERYVQPCKQVRPREVQEWISASDGDKGITFAAGVAVWDFQDPTDHPVDYAVLQPILLASRKSCHGEGNWYLQKGDHHFEFSLVSHQPGWQNGYRDAISTAIPPAVILQTTQQAHDGLADEFSFGGLKAGHVDIAAIKKAEDRDEMVLRMVEWQGRDSRIALDWFKPIKSITRTNLIEEKFAEDDINRDNMSIGHHSIETFNIELE